MGFKPTEAESRLLWSERSTSKPPRLGWVLIIVHSIILFVCAQTDTLMLSEWRAIYTCPKGKIQMQRKKTCLMLHYKLENSAHLNRNWKLDKFSRLNYKKVFSNKTFKVHWSFPKCKCTLFHDQVIMHEQCSNLFIHKKRKTS